MMKNEINPETQKDKNLRKQTRAVINMTMMITIRRVAVVVGRIYICCIVLQLLHYTVCFSMLRQCITM